MQALEGLRTRLREVDDLRSAGALLRWDQQVLMPPGGAAARGRQLATLGRLAHERLTDAAVGRLLDRAERETAGLADDSDAASLVRVARRQFERAARIPAALVAELDAHCALTYQAWAAADDFAAVRPLLERTVALSRRVAECTPGFACILDPLMDAEEPGLKAAEVRALFAALRAGLVPLVRAIAARPPVDDACLRQHAPIAAQLAFGRRVVEAFGFDFGRGRLDLTAHPFTMKSSLGDVRITTRVREDVLTGALFPLLHECGHALYEQGLRPELEGTPLAAPASFAVDESQSRLWENRVGRSRELWEHLYPQLQRAFPAQLGAVELDTFYRALHRVQPSPVRGFADEVTYDLHVMLRFDLELDLLEGRLAVADLPRAWGERFEADLGIRVPDDRRGVLQDVHWYSGPVGGVFQGYTLGNVLSAQLHAAALAAHPEIPAQATRGAFDTLRGWLREHVYQHGAKLTAGELVRRATGQGLSVTPYLDALWSKYGALHGLGDAARPPRGPAA